MEGEKRERGRERKEGWSESESERREREGEEKDIRQSSLVYTVMIVHIHTSIDSPKLTRT